MDRAGGLQAKRVPRFRRSCPRSAGTVLLAFLTAPWRICRSSPSPAREAKTSARRLHSALARSSLLPLRSHRPRGHLRVAAHICIIICEQRGLRPV